MSMNATPSGERVHIGIFGRRNAGKSSLINALTGQELAVVSQVAGTTTDPVSKAMELLPLGPVVFIDTPGLDDDGELGEKRVRKALEVLDRIDIALVVRDCRVPAGKPEERLLSQLEQRRLPVVKVANKADLLHDKGGSIAPEEMLVSAQSGQGVFELKERIAALQPRGQERRVIGDLLQPGDRVVLVVPIDKAAPKGRLILPQQQTIRDILDAGATAVVTRETELEDTLSVLKERPRFVVTDSQVFAQVARITPKDVPLTSFSILMARYKGDLPLLVSGAAELDKLAQGDRVLISEGCTHHRQCGDIGTVKLPAAIEKYTGVKPEYQFTSGGEFPRDLSGIRLVIHCGGCTLTEQAMASRIAIAREQGVPMTNYGTVLAKVSGILDRAVFQAGLLEN